MTEMSQSVSLVPGHPNRAGPGVRAQDRPNFDLQPFCNLEARRHLAAQLITRVWSLGMHQADMPEPAGRCILGDEGDESFDRPGSSADAIAWHDQATIKVQDRSQVQQTSDEALEARRASSTHQVFDGVRHDHCVEARRDARRLGHCIVHRHARGE